MLYYPLDSWFIRASAAKERMAELNNTINWKPAHTGTGRFGAWLDNLQDWNLSRSRYWGVPMPIWRTEDESEERCIASVAELKQAIEEANAVLGLQQTAPADLHRHSRRETVDSKGQFLVRTVAPVGIIGVVTFLDGSGERVVAVAEPAPVLTGAAILAAIL